MRADDHGPCRWAWTLLLAAFACLLRGQVTVSLQPGRQPTALERACMQLGQPESRAAGLRTLVQAGAVAVPLLVAAAQRDDATSLPALRALAAMGGTARSAAAPLAKLAQGTTQLARAAAEALAAIGERDTVLATDWNGNRVVELDSAGKLLREAAVNGPWSVQPIAGDRLLVCRYQERKVVELAWDGTTTELPIPEGHPIRARRLVDGTTIVALMAPNQVVALAADGKETWRIPFDARTFVVLENDNLLLLDHEQGKLLEVTAAGTVVGEIETKGKPMSLDRCTDGALLVQFSGDLQTLDAAGKLVRSHDFGGVHTQLLPDGGFACAATGVHLRDAQGTIRWTHAGGTYGDVLARIAPQ
jgi:hypothetical protein